uniref:rRNA biogenesis protein RRP36 n=1 Tax=Coturnix japonica TaxID=93934 RepID=A0A8C2TXU1_COTJA
MGTGTGGETGPVASGRGDRAGAAGRREGGTLVSCSGGWKCLQSAPCDPCAMLCPPDEAELSLEERLQMQSESGTRASRQPSNGEKAAKPGKAPVKQRLNKKGPVEMSAKKPMPFLRQVVPVTKKVHRDPRFDDLSGEYNPEIFMKTYSFLDTIKKQEKEMVQRQLKKCRDVEQKEKLQQLLNRMVSLKRKLELAEKYVELKRSGKLESFLNKKRKRNAVKDKRRLPSQKNL